MGILQARILEWASVPSSRGSSQPRDWTSVFLHGRWILYHLSYQGSPRSCACQKLVKLGKRTRGGPLVAPLPLTAQGVVGKTSYVASSGPGEEGFGENWVCELELLEAFHLGSLWELWTKKTCSRGCSLDGRLAGLHGLWVWVSVCVCVCAHVCLRGWLTLVTWLTSVPAGREPLAIRGWCPASVAL